MIYDIRVYKIQGVTELIVQVEKKMNLYEKSYKILEFPVQNFF